MHIGLAAEGGVRAIPPARSGFDSRASNRRTGLIWTARAEAREPCPAETARDAEAGNNLRGANMNRGKSAIRDLIYRIEGFGDEPDYEIRSIARVGGRIVINIIDDEASYEPRGGRAETNPGAAASAGAQDCETDGGQTGGEDESN